LNPPTQNRQKPTSFDVIEKGSPNTAFQFTSNDIQAVKIIRNAYGEDNVIVTLNNNRKKEWASFTESLFGKKFEIYFNGELTNQGTVLATIEDGVLALKKFQNDEKGAMDFSARLQKKATFEDVSEKESNMRLANPHFNLGAQYIDQGKSQEALDELNTALNLYPNDGRGFFYRGLAYANLNQSDKALEDFNKAIEIDPKLADAYMGRAGIYFAKNEFSKGEEDLNKAKTLGYEVSPEIMEALKKAKTQTESS
jgi:tetratricopeptide (TPR) repeat protein